MLRKHCNRWLLIVVLALMLGACIPYSFSPPKEVHINPGDHVALGKIAVDTKGRSHIVGNVFNHMVYYLTRFGEPIVTHNFTMGVPGTQYNQDIAVTDNGDVYIVWVESRSGLGKFACWQKLPFFMPPGEEWPNDCEPLDEVNIQTTGNVRVVARGNKAYAVYDSMYTGDSGGRIGALMYKELTHPATTGHVHWYTENFETGFIYSLDLGIDSRGYLHVGFHDNYTVTGSPPFTERLSLHSNASAYADGDMAQHWFIYEGNDLNESVPVSLGFHLDSADVERAALASISQISSTRDLIYIDSCVANGCTGQNSHLVTLPSSWSTYSVIDEVEILGIEQTLYLSFIGFDSVIPQQVYFMEAYSSNTPTNLSQTDDTWKFTLEMTKVDGRDPSFPVSFPAIAWIESDLTSKTNYYVSDGFFNKTMVFSKYCDPVFSVGNISSNGIYLSGAWLDCEETWFTTQAWTNQLPLIMK
jgi:hypothetical protein